MGMKTSISHPKYIVAVYFITMKRRLFKLALFLLLGAIVNVAVAWGLCIFSDIKTVSTMIRQSPTNVDLDWLVVLGWTPMPESEQWIYSPYVIDSYQTGISISWICEQAKHNPLYDSKGYEFIGMIPAWEVAATLHAGWPLLSQLGRVVEERALQRDHDFLGLTIGGSIHTGLPSLESPVWINSFSYARPDENKFSSNHRRMIPLRPIWPGFAINTLFYAAILCLPFAPFQIRRYLRVKRNLCIKCGYDLRGTSGDVCPECGNEDSPSN